MYILSVKLSLFKNENATKSTFVFSQVKHGHVECVMDEDINCSAIEVHGRNME